MDQAEKLRQISQNLEFCPQPRVIAVTSGKGGVGKTNLVANLGICLAEGGYRVLLLDADLGTANLDVLLGMFTEYSLYEVIRGYRSLDEVIVTGPGGIKLIPGAAGFREMSYLDGIRKEQLEKRLGEYTQKCDFLLIDTGAGISKNVLSFISIASEVIVVVTPEPTSLADAYCLIKVICRFNLSRKIHIVVNMASSIFEANQTAEKITHVCNHFLLKNIDTLGYVLDNNCVGQAVREQVPFVQRYPKSGAALQVRAVARALETGSVSNEPFREGFVSKLMRIFG
jgi:flagellar biosynthesis protein FlhG